MVIDIHTHIFPDKIAEPALKKLSGIIGIEPGMNGTAEGLLASMEGAGIDTGVVLPVVTDVRQFDSIFRFAVLINETYGYFTDRGAHNRLISLAGIHPDDPDLKDHLRLIAEEGFTGVKIHPNYQDVMFNDIRYKRLLSMTSELGLFVLVHTGWDPVTPGIDYCTPDMVLDVMKDVSPKDMVLAHLGCKENYTEAEEKLCGLDLYLDTAFSMVRVSEEQFARMVIKHGADKILFGTDAPWTHQDEAVRCLRENKLVSEEAKEMIFSENAAGLLKI